MKRTLILTKRNIKEMCVDPVSLGFCVCFPLVMLIVMSLIFKGNSAGGAVMFQIDNFAPGICAFGFTFTMLYTALMITGDKNSAFMNRLSVSPVKTHEYLLSYVFSFLPVAVIQTVIFYAVSLIFGLKLNGGTLLSIVYQLPSAIFYCSVGLLIGAICNNEKQTGPICSIIITASGLLGGVWMPVTEMGGGLLTACKCLPFYNGVYMAQGAVKGDFGAVYPCILIVLGYALITFIIGVAVFKLKAKNK